MCIKPAREYLQHLTPTAAEGKEEPMATEEPEEEKPEERVMSGELAERLVNEVKAWIEKAVMEGLENPEAGHTTTRIFAGFSQNSIFPVQVF